MNDQVQALAERIAAAVLEDEKPENGGCDISGGMFGPNFSAIVRELARATAPETSVPTVADATQPIWLVSDAKGEHVMLCPKEPTQEALANISAQISSVCSVTKYFLLPASLMH